MSRVLAYADTMGIPVWDAAARTRRRSTRSAPPRVKALHRFMSTMERLKERADGGAPVGEMLQETLSETGYLEALEAERTIEAQGRIENLEELVQVGREYDAHERGRARSRSSCSRSRCSPTPTASATTRAS